MPAVSLFAELSILQKFNTYIDYRYPAPSALRAAPPMGSQEDSALSFISQAFLSIAITQNSEALFHNSIYYHTHALKPFVNVSI